MVLLSMNTNSYINKKPLYFLYDEGPNNLGDVFNPYLLDFFGVNYITLIGDQKRKWHGVDKIDLMAVGSTLQRVVNPSYLKAQYMRLYKHKVLNIYGTGFIEERKSPHEYFIRPLNILALRGEVTKKRCEEILKRKLDGIALGDPGLLFSKIFPDSGSYKRYDVGIVPHYIHKLNKYLNNIQLRKLKYKIIDIQNGVENTLTDIRDCRFILSSAMHGIIAADSYGIPNKWFKLDIPVVGDEYKYHDYYSAFGIYNQTPINLVSEIIMDEDIQKLASDYKLSRSMVEDKQVQLIKAFENLIFE